MDFCSLQHLQARRSTDRERCLLATVRPQGLATLSTAYALRALVGFVSRRQRSWDSPFGAFSTDRARACFSTRRPPTCRYANRCATDQGQRPDRHAPTSGRYARPESLANAACLAPAPAGGSLGSSPLQGSRRRHPARDFRPSDLSRASSDGPFRTRQPAPQSLASISDRRSRARISPRRRSGRPSWGSCTWKFRHIRTREPPGLYVFTMRRDAHCCRPPPHFGGPARSAGAEADQPRCYASRPHRRMGNIHRFRVIGNEIFMRPESAQADKSRLRAAPLAQAAPASRLSTARGAARFSRKSEKTQVVNSRERAARSPRPRNHRDAPRRAARGGTAAQKPTTGEYFAAPAGRRWFRLSVTLGRGAPRCDLGSRGYGQTLNRHCRNASMSKKSTLLSLLQSEFASGQPGNAA